MFFVISFSLDLCQDFKGKFSLDLCQDFKGFSQDLCQGFKGKSFSRFVSIFPEHADAQYSFCCQYFSLKSCIVIFFLFEILHCHIFFFEILHSHNFLYCQKQLFVFLLHSIARSINGNKPYFIKSKEFNLGDKARHGKHISLTMKNTK